MMLYMLFALVVVMKVVSMGVIDCVGSAGEKWELLSDDEEEVNIGEKPFRVIGDFWSLVMSGAEKPDVV